MVMTGPAISRAPLQRGIERRHALFDMAMDVLDDHDGVIDHKPDGQHEGEKRQEIDRIAERQEQHRDADQRQRDRHHRDDRRAHIAEEQEDDDDDDGRRLHQRLADFHDRGVDELGRVIGDLRLEARRQLRAGCPGIASATALMTVSGLASGVTLMPMNTAFRPSKDEVEFEILRAQIDAWRSGRA